MGQRVIRLAQLARTKKRPDSLLPVSPATVWRWVKNGTFPKPFKLAAGTTVWDAVAVEAFIAAQQEVNIK